MRGDATVSYDLDRRTFHKMRMTIMISATRAAPPPAMATTGRLVEELVEATLVKSKKKRKEFAIGTCNRYYSKKEIFCFIGKSAMGRITATFQ